MKKQFCSLERWFRGQSKILYEFPRFLGAFVMKLTTGRMIDGVPCGRIDMVIKDLDLEPKVEAMMREFLRCSPLMRASRNPKGFKCYKDNEFEYDDNGHKCVHIGKVVVEVHQSIWIDRVVRRFVEVEGVMEEVVEEVGGVVKTTSRGARVVGMVGCRASGGMTNGVVTGDDSFKDMSMTLVRATFLGGFLMDEEALEALVMFKDDLRTGFTGF
ncbi:hypothetical protein Tco_0475549 [Tanacetum coccineum]